MSATNSLVAIINGDAMKKEFVKALGSPKMIDRFLRLATSTIKQTPKLAQCSQESVIGALLKSAQLNLEPNTILGECYLIPRQIHGKWEANFELGYKGLIKLAYRSGEVKLVQAFEVYESDRFDVDYGENKIIHKPLLTGNRGTVVAYWARYFLKDGTSDFKVWSRSDVEAHRDQYSKGAGTNFSPWKTAFDQMAKKSVIKDVLRYAPCSVEDYAHAMAADQTTINAAVPTDGATAQELFRVAVATSEHKKQIEEGEDEPDTEKVDDPEWKKSFDALQAMIASRVSKGADPVELENQMGMGFNDAEYASVEKLKEAIAAITPAPAAVKKG